LSDRKLLCDRGGSFLFDKAAFRSKLWKAARVFGKKIGFDLITGASFWQDWAELLTRWSGEKP
jgi:hypothetical protein